MGIKYTYKLTKSWHSIARSWVLEPDRTWIRILILSRPLTFSGKSLNLSDPWFQRLEIKLNEVNTHLEGMLWEMNEIKYMNTLTFNRIFIKR